MSNYVASLTYLDNQVAIELERHFILSVFPSITFLPFFYLVTSRWLEAMFVGGNFSSPFLPLLVYHGDLNTNYTSYAAGALWLLVCITSILIQTGIALQYLRTKPTHTVSLIDLATADLLHTVFASGITCGAINSFFVFDLRPSRYVLAVGDFKVLLLFGVYWYHLGKLNQKIKILFKHVPLTSLAQ